MSARLEPLGLVAWIGFNLPANLDSANIGYNIKRVTTEGVALGPILMGVSKPAHILTPAATVRRVVNMTAIAAV